MGSPGSGPTDCTVGSIVWVRRRNGSWWPGKILSPEELDATHITSPRSGTPVKLLGREDASVDWYNLEKSKRVKAFRCGDFDECIERVETAQGLPIRKREKYARREDAILHALELEKEILRREGKLVPEKVISKPCTINERLVISGDQDVCKRKQEPTKCLKPNHVGDVLHLQKEKKEDRSGCEDDHIGAAPRMRGLQDFGLRTASSKRKVPCPNGPGTSSKPMACNSPASSSGDHRMEMPNYALGNLKEHITRTLQSKRPRYMYTLSDALDTPESLLSEREMARTSLAAVDSHRSFPQKDPPEFLEEIGSDSSESDTASSDTGEDTDDDLHMLSGAGHRLEHTENTFSRHITAEEESTSSEDHDESSFSGESSYLYPRDNPDFGDGAVSKWRLKGKRNIRNLPRKCTDKTKARRNRFEDEPYRELNKRAFGQKSFGYDLDFNGANDASDGTDETDLSERELGGRLIGESEKSYHLSKRNASRFNIFGNDMLDWDDDDPWEDRFNGYGVEIGSWNLGEKMHSPLIDVDLEVQGSYQKGPVPIVSLMSKLDGRAIIGHPIEIEVLTISPYLPSIDYFGDETAYHDKPFVLPHAWKTARRSNSRVPRLHPVSSLDEYANDDHHPLIDQGRKAHKRLSLGNFSGSDMNSVRRSVPRIPRPQQKQQIKKANASATQKTRALSSFGNEQGHGMKLLQDSGSNFQMPNLSSRQVLAGPPTVACIPIKLVFSRLLEKINRPPTKTSMPSRERRNDQS